MMNLVLVLRAELICLIILLFLTFVSRAYRMGKDGQIFNRLLICAITHVVMDGVTVWTVNYHTASVWNDIAHMVFFLSAVMFSYQMCLYVLNMSRPKHMDRFRRLIALIPATVYLVLMAVRVLKIEYIQVNGTMVSAGPAPTVGYVIALTYFAIAICSIVIHWHVVGRHFKMTMLPMLFLLIVSVIIQTNIKEFLFTGCAVTGITVAFFFTLENPAAVLERKVMMDALSGLGSRSSYEHDMEEYDREFEKEKDSRFIFLFVDINNLRSVNGLYGHQEGDSYISKIAVMLMTNLRGAEHIYRMGGDEFLAIYRKADEKVVIRDIKRVQAACLNGKEQIGYTPELAIGYAVSDPKYNTLRDVLRVADYMMYRNKADLKREIAEDAIRHTGTHLNLSGLTDRVFDAMCLTSEAFYPFLNNLETGVTRVAPAMVEFFGLESDFMEDFASVWQKRIHPDDLAEYLADVSDTLNGRKQYHFCNYRAMGKNGEYVDITCRGGVYHGRDGEPDVFAGYMVNRGAPELFDPATGLKNHRAMTQCLSDHLKQGCSGVVIRLELRNQNRIRMLYGGSAASSLIRNLADDLLRFVGEEGEVFSSHGNSFFLCLPGFDEKKADELYHQIRSHCAAGILTGDELIPVDIVGGAVKMPDETLTNAGAVRQAAIFASEEAGRNSRSSLVFFGQPGTSTGSGNKDLLRAIQHDCVMSRSGFFLRFQPIIQIQTGKVAGAEALLRWRGEEYGEVQPSRFIAFLENDPAYEPLGYDIIRKAVRTAKAIRTKIPEFRINVNMTAIQLLKDDFILQVQRILEEEQFDPSFLILELTERCKELEFALLDERVEELRKIGVRIALDDMGTGYSTIDLLLHLQADEIKLDMAFTQELQGAEKHELLTRTLCAAAARGKVDICFEGVETEETLEYLKGYGNVLAQGYYFDKPLLEEEFERKYCGEKAES